MPPTDRKGRVHSSTVTVAVLPEPRASELRLEPRDLRFETYRASGPGGQHRNTTDSAVRVTHLPTGVQAQSAEERSQGRNKALALAALRARLAEQAQRAGRRQRNRQRREQVGRGRRADKVRTVAYQRGRVGDHRSGKRISIRRFERGELEGLSG